MSTDSSTRVFGFDTTHQAMWAEDVAREQAIPVEVVPAPPGVKAMCGVALRVNQTQESTLAAALDQKGIVYTVIRA